MKFRDVLNLAAKATAMMNPSVGGAIMLINKVLDTKDQLPPGANVAELNTAIDKLSPTAAIELREQQVELQITESNNWASVQKHLADADAKGASTRPAIANRMAWVIAIVIAMLSLSMVYAVVQGDADMLASITSLVPVILTLIGTPCLVVMQYIGARTKEKSNRYAAATGQPISVGGILQTLLGGK